MVEAAHVTAAVARDAIAVAGAQQAALAGFADLQCPDGGGVSRLGPAMILSHSSAGVNAPGTMQERPTIAIGEKLGSESSPTGEGHAFQRRAVRRSAGHRCQPTEYPTGC